MDHPPHRAEHPPALPRAGYFQEKKGLPRGSLGILASSESLYLLLGFLELCLRLSQRF